MITSIISFLLVKRRFIFPVCVISIFICLVAFSINGSSVGMYHEYFYGSNTKDPNLLYGKPQSIRSDEWLVNTPLTVAQYKQGMHQINRNFQTGVNMGIITNTPYIGWSTIFKPDALSFLVMPLNMAFAFMWWLPLVMLLLASYFFILQLLPRKYLLASCLAVFFAFNPFIFWWYQNGTLTPLWSGLLILILSMNIISNKKMPFLERIFKPHLHNIIWMILLIYCVVVFALVVYPPFQIPIALVLVFFVIGYILQTLPVKDRLKHIIRIALFFLGTSIPAIAIVVIYLLSSYSAVHAIENTAYPGHREVTTGGYSVSEALTTYLQPQLERKNNSQHYINNPSEASNFLIPAYLLIIPSIVLVIYCYVKKKIDWLLTILTLGNLLFLCVLFIPGLDIVNRLLFLNSVPHQRLMIGEGLLGLITLVLLIRAFVGKSWLAKDKIVKIVFIASIVVTAISALAAGFITAKEFPLFVSNKLLIISFCLLLFCGILLVCIRKYIYIGALLLIVFAIGSVFRLIVLYHGISLVSNNPLVSAVDRNSSPRDTWGVVNAIYIENVPEIANRHSLTGTILYPNVKFYKQHFPESNPTIYNRYAHVYLSTTTKNSLTLMQPDLVAMSIDSCKDVSVSLVTRLLSVSQISLPCFKLMDTIDLPNATYYIYKRT